jgi:hypothetical protein
VLLGRSRPFKAIVCRKTLKETNMATHDANLGEDRMRRHFAAEVLFLDPADVPRARKALAAVNCEYTIDPDAHDPYSDAVFGMVTGTSSLEQGGIGDWLARIVGPHGGDVVEWGYGEPWKIRD